MVDYPHTHRSTRVATAIRDVIYNSKDLLGIDNVFYGDHQNIPTGMAVCVWPGAKRRPLQSAMGPGGMTMNSMDINVVVYCSQVLSEEEGRFLVDSTAESVEDLVHEDTTLGGIIHHGYFQEWIPGEVFRDNSMFRTVRLLYVGGSKTSINP